MKKLFWLSIIVFITANSQADCFDQIEVTALKKCARVDVFVGTTANGTQDTLARDFADYLSSKSIPAIPVNKPGATGKIAMTELVNSKNKNCSVMVVATAHLISAPQMGQIPYTVPNDLVPLTLMINNPMFLVVNSKKLPAATIKNFQVAVAKNSYIYSTSGIGTMGHTLGMMIQEKMNAQTFVHSPMKGTAEASLIVQGGDADFTLLSPFDVKSLVGNDKVTVIASSSEKDEEIPGTDKKVPPLHKDISALVWFGFVAAKGIDKVASLEYSRALQCLREQPSFVTKYKDMDYTIESGNHLDFETRIKSDLHKWTPIITLIKKQNPDYRQ